VAAVNNYGGHHFGNPDALDYQPKCWTSEQGMAAVVVAEEKPHSDILE